MLTRTTLALLTGAVLMSGGCGDSGEGDDDGKITICLLPKLKGIDYFTACHKGALEAEKELGNVRVIYDGPTTGSAEKQAEMIEKWTLQEVDVIAVSPNSPAVLKKPMSDAQSEGVKTISWDADSAAGTRSFFVNQATGQAIGYGLVDALADDLGGDAAEGDVAIVSGSTTAANQNEWIGHMKKRLSEKYPKLNLVTIKYPGEDQNKAFQDATDLMKTYPALKGIFGITSVSFPGCAEAVSQSDRKNEVLVTGLATPNTMKEFVKKDGVVNSFVLWNAVDLGYLTIYVAEGIATGKLKAGATEFEAGRLGKVKVVGDNVLLGDIIVFKKENIDDFDF